MAETMQRGKYAKGIAPEREIAEAAAAKLFSEKGYTVGTSELAPR